MRITVGNSMMEWICSSVLSPYNQLANLYNLYCCKSFYCYSLM